MKILNSIVQNIYTNRRGKQKGKRIDRTEGGGNMNINAEINKHITNNIDLKNRSIFAIAEEILG